MRVLIAKQNEEVFRTFDSKLKFTEASKNTSTFNITPTKFQKLRDWVREQGYNPFALMHW